MTRLASVTALCLLALVIPSGLAGPACATKNYRQQQCIERCKAKWGYPGSLMGSSRWGPVMRKGTDKSTQAMDAAVSQACGFGSSSADIQGAVAGASASITSSLSSSAQTAQSTTHSLTASITSSSSSTTSSSSSSFSLTSETGANLFDTVVPTSTSIFSTITTSTSPSLTSTSTSTTQESTSTSEPPPPPPPTSTTSSSEATPTSESGNNGSGSDQGTKDQGSGSSNSNSGSTPNSDIQTYLSAHNSIRAQHGAADLTWSDDAANKAQTWANNCNFEHSGGKLGAFGENLAAGTGGSYGITAAIKSWTDEVKDYKASNPVASHFTQVVWKATTQVGCAVTSCDGIFDASFGPAKFYVCEYFPQGNVIGKFDTNVQA
ncbi:hypothetical protein E1B28_001250 [Marasmius oreades]|uniref:SCP domain-containing protein n=1 Tax=Marasmius oreades TaxID=181124 RepID=A0A9P7V3C6_9AGAR|nr:uncharacterized protein E1B28_001250 [Marasmius oreades]KAG7099397.1 hypothetical protein E1B28_001250 [Marasmius oreades]